MLEMENLLPYYVIHVLWLYQLILLNLLEGMCYVRTLYGFAVAIPFLGSVAMF
jgi:hypothetical protein